MVSDCHLGSGTRLQSGKLNPLEDFHKDEKFVEFLEYHTTGKFHDTEVELVINGDFFDMLAVKTNSRLPYGILENIAVYKIRKILNGHPKVCAALQKFIEGGHRVVMIWGNHDAGLWARVRGSDAGLSAVRGGRFRLPRAEFIDKTKPQ